ncbi:hypothetical protein [Azohydromonas australica]|uniref:PIN-like domain-containing protein n=1 Tax=Azohydromonas australica TaxID=364039 RepID=UPI0004112EA9|nr:hypothetical protein [Azohydromonas australica]
MSLRFLFDNNLPPALARALKELSRREAGHVQDVIALRDRFPQNTPDTVWLEELGREGGWSIVSGDQFNKSDAEKELIRKAGFNVFVLHRSWAKYPYWPKAANMVAWWPRIIEQASLASRSAFRVPWKTADRFEQIKV